MTRPCCRTIVNVIALLAAGAAVNVAVAWGLVAKAPWKDQIILNSTTARSAKMPEFLMKVGWSATPEDDAATYDFESIEPGPHSVGCIIWAEVENPKPGVAKRGYLWLRVVAVGAQSGWPSRSMAGEIWSSGTMQDAAQGNPEVWTPHHAIPFGLPAGPVQWTTQFLPLRPLWPGFAINTVFYAGVLWVLFCGPFALRRMIRRRRGQCARCAYPIGQNERCTECGAAVTPRRDAGV